MKIETEAAQLQPHTEEQAAEAKVQLQLFDTERNEATDLAKLRAWKKVKDFDSTFLY